MFQGRSPRAASTPKTWNDLELQLSTIQARDLIVVSDMTGTLVTQTADGMLPLMRESQKALLEKEMMLVLATADSGHSVKQFFLDPLGQVVDKNLFVVHSVGAWRGKVQDGHFQEVSRGTDLTLEHRTILLEAMDRALCHHLELSFPLFSEEKRAEIIQSGRRVSLAQSSPLLGNQSFIEILPSKAAIFFLEEKIAGPLQQKIFTEYVSDANVQRVVKTGGYQMIQGGNYVDICTCTKEEGVGDILERFKPHDRRSLIVLGDSENDLGILSKPYVEFDRILRVFVGQSSTVVDSLMAGPFKDEFFLLPGAHCEGSARLFKVLNR